jgi:hypothetical protein
VFCDLASLKVSVKSHNVIICATPLTTAGQPEQRLFHTSSHYRDCLEAVTPTATQAAAAPLQATNNSAGQAVKKHASLPDWIVLHIMPGWVCCS